MDTLFYNAFFIVATECDCSGVDVILRIVARGNFDPSTEADAVGHELLLAFFRDVLLWAGCHSRRNQEIHGELVHGHVGHDRSG